eukprot:jgi/Mesvir1/21664/Mv04085-RA.1
MPSAPAEIVGSDSEAEDGKWLYHPSTGEKCEYNKDTLQAHNKWLKDTPYQRRKTPTGFDFCFRCGLLRPLSHFAAGVKPADSPDCRACRKQMADFAKKKESDLRAKADKEVARLVGDGRVPEFTFVPQSARGDKEFEEAAWDAHKHSTGPLGDMGNEGIPDCFLCGERVDNVYTVKVSPGSGPHFHAGGVCCGCALKVLVDRQDPGDIDCPICHKEERRRVAKLQFPYFVFDPTMTMLAHLGSGEDYGMRDFYDIGVEGGEEAPQGEEEEDTGAGGKLLRGGTRSGKRAADKLIRDIMTEESRAVEKEEEFLTWKTQS